MLWAYDLPESPIESKLEVWWIVSLLRSQKTVLEKCITGKHRSDGFNHAERTSRLCQRVIEEVADRERRSEESGREVNL